MRRHGPVIALSLATVLLVGCGGGDAGSDGGAADDLQPRPDQAGPISDLATARDLTLLDGSAPGDAARPDLAAAVDGGAADLPAPLDLAANDLALPDLAVPDLAVPPDLSVPDLSRPPDLAVPPDLSRPPDLVTPPDLVGLDLARPDLAEPVDLAEPDLAMPLGMVTASLSAVALGQDCKNPVPADAVTFTANLKITNVGMVDVGPVTAMSGEISQFLNPVATFTIVPTFTMVLKPGQSETIAVNKLANSGMPANGCMTLQCNGGYNVAISYMGPAVPLGNRAVSGLTFPTCLF